MKRQIEILAPAGSYEGMRAAMNAGCDAVYIGGSNFGARAYANNLDSDTLLKAIDEAHIRDKKLYLTVNTLLKERELVDELYRFVEKYYLQGLDAVIVQDVGVMHFIHEHFPKLPIHASTQMTLTMAQGTGLLKDYGVTRLVTSRELSLKEIKKIRENTDLEIETFVHGALCYCYSGQCLMSSVIGGRSGNRGRCAQPCRMPYQFYSDNKRFSSGQDKYLLSPKDINTVALIPELVEAGIDSFKIEGRMKRPEYAAAVSHVYRKYLDLYFELGKDEYLNRIKSNEFTKDMINLLDIFNRGGFSEGYGKTYNGKKMMSLQRPNHSGVYVGDVTSVKGTKLQIILKEDINAQDILEIRGKEQEEYEFTVKDSLERGEILTTNAGVRPDHKGQSDSSDNIKQERKTRDAKISDNRIRKFPGRGTDLSWKMGPDIRVGDKVYRTKNNVLLEQLASEYLNKDVKQPITGVLRAKPGEKLTLTITYQDHTVTAYHDTVQEAMKQPMTKEKLLAPLRKTGDTLYFFETLEADAEDNIFVPVAWLNEIRRNAVQMLQDRVTESFRRKREELIEYNIKMQQIDEYGRSEESNAGFPEIPMTKFLGVCVSIKTKEQYDTAITYEEITSIYAEYDAFEQDMLLMMARQTSMKNKGFYLMLPHICRLSVFEKLKRELTPFLKEEGVTGFILKNFEEISLLQSLSNNESFHKELILNHNMYVYNNEARKFWNELGFHHFTAPLELNSQELKKLGISDCDFVVYGYLPLMVSVQCLYESSDGCLKRKNEGQNKTGYLIDRLGEKFFVQTNCNGCYNTIYNGKCLSLLKHSSEVKGLNPRNIRLDFTLETKEETAQVIASFLDTFLSGRAPGLELENYTMVHFKRGVE